MHDHQFEDIVHHLVTDLGPMDIPAEVDMFCTISLPYEDVQFTAETSDPERFVSYLYHTLSNAEFVSLKDVNGVHHVIRTSQVVHLKAVEETDDE